MMPLALFAATLLQSTEPTSHMVPGFKHHTCKDRFGRSINYYLSPEVENKNLPIALFIMGSSGQSIWPIMNGRTMGGLQNLLLSRVQEKLRVLVVEKPGVEFGFSPTQPGTAIGANEGFLREHTLERWAAANDAALSAALAKPGVDTKRVLAIGHSEGGIVAAALAARNSKVTGVASLAGGGPKQSEDLKVLFGKPMVEQMLAQIARDPKSTTKMIFGHPHLRWSTFLSTSTIEEALKSKARFIVFQGTKDKSVNPKGAEQLENALKKENRDVTLIKIADGDHSFSTNPQDQTGKGFESVFDQILAWFKKS